MPSNEKAGSKLRNPSACRRSAMRTCDRGSFALSVKFSFRSIVELRDAHQKVAPGVESFDSHVKSRRRRNELDGIHPAVRHSHPFRCNGKVAARQIEVERTVLAERIADPDAVGGLCRQWLGKQRLVSASGDRESSGYPENRHSARVSLTRTNCLTR